MKNPPNGSTSFEIAHEEMGGWVRTFLGKGTAPEDFFKFLSHAMNKWFLLRPQYRMRFVVPFVKDGDTVELHTWFDQVLFKDASHLQSKMAPPES